MNDRYETRLSESKAMELTPHQQFFSGFIQQVKEHEQERMFLAIDRVWNWALFKSDLSAEDFKQQLKLELIRDTTQ